MKFETKIIPNLADFGRDGKISTAGMLRIFEDLGSAHSESVGDGVKSAIERGTAWVLTDWRLSCGKPVYTAAEQRPSGSSGSCTLSDNRGFAIHSSI